MWSNLKDDLMVKVCPGLRLSLNTALRTSELQGEGVKKLVPSLPGICEGLQEVKRGSQTCDGFCNETCGDGVRQSLRATSRGKEERK